MIRMSAYAAAALVALTAAATAGAAAAAPLTLKLTGVQPRGGHLLVAVQTKGQYMQQAGVAGSILPGTSSGEVTVDLGELPAGEYAVSVLHDADDNKTMTLAGARPVEGWASVNAKALKARPTFDQVKFQHGATPQTLTLPMVDYPAK